MAASIRVHAIPLFSDNYCWRIEDVAHGTQVLVDPADAPAVIAALPKDGPEVVGVLTTHHHWDHAGGNEGIAKAFPGVEIVAGATEHAVAAASKRVSDGETFTLGHLSVKALHTPCHTKGHVCYVVEGGSDQPAAVFTGDTLFAGGCGRFFEGSAAEMHTSLGKLASLSPSALVYCGHEYTVSNLKFGLHVEPDNKAIAEKLERCEKLRAEGKMTLPSTIGEELLTNVFLRTSEPSVQAFARKELAAGGAATSAAASAAAASAASATGGAGKGDSALDPVVVLDCLRTAKNNFKA